MTPDLRSGLSIMTGPAIAPDPGARIDRIVARQAELRPNSPAVRCGGETLTYRALLDRADEIAAALIASGIGGSDVVAVQLPRGVDLVCVILGVLRADAIYTVMPLDWPAERRGEVLRQTGSRLCVTLERDRFDAPRPMTTQAELINGAAVPAPRTDEGDLGDLGQACCVFFTSGSTGQPKSTVAPHRGVIRVVFDPVLEFDQDTVMLQAHSPAWDTFALELWGPLLHGGVTVLRESTYFSHEDIRDAVRSGVTTLFLTPTVFNNAVTEEPECLAGLDAVVLGGERVSPAHLRTFLDLYPSTKVFNIYGPVEATICVTIYPITTDDDFNRDLPIGRSVPATSIHLLDDALDIVAVGDVGEIAVGGDGVAYGYLGNRQETAARFVSLPLGGNGEPVEVYLTGDYGWIDEHGRLRFEGRRDRQLKILGLRVEPREVERVSSAVPGVRAAIAVPVPPDKPEGLALVYVAKADGPEPEDVRQAIMAALPPQFMPRAIRRVDALPLNANGKVDLRAVGDLVPVPDGPVPGRPDGSPLATLLVELQELTGRSVDADSDVVDLGLTSITALKLIGRINAAHGVRVPMRVVFRSRTPAAVADWIARQ